MFSSWLCLNLGGFRITLFLIVYSFLFIYCLSFWLDFCNGLQIGCFWCKFKGSLYWGFVRFFCFLYLLRFFLCRLFDWSLLLHFWLYLFCWRWFGLRFRWRKRWYNLGWFGCVLNWIIRWNFLFLFLILNLIFQDIDKEIHNFRSFFLLMNELPIVRTDKIVIIAQFLRWFFLAKEFIEVFTKRCLNLVRHKNFFHNLFCIIMVSNLLVNFKKLSLLLNYLSIERCVLFFQMIQIISFNRFLKSRRHIN